MVAVDAVPAFRTNTVPFTSVVVAKVLAKVEVALVDVVIFADVPHSILSIIFTRGVDVVFIYIVAELVANRSVDVT